MAQKLALATQKLKASIGPIDPTSTQPGYHRPNESASNTPSLDKLARRQLSKQRFLIPNNVGRLIKPVLIRTIRQFQVEIPEQMRDDEAHLMVCETTRA
jgi:hypothetical protein